MKPRSCVGCARPVVELDEQFEKLDSYFVEDGRPPVETAGYWHTTCLRESGHGAAWSAARLRNHVGVRGYAPIAETGAWTVIQHPRTRERLAFSHHGELLGLGVARGKGRKVDGGVVYPVAEELCLELEDRDVIRAIQDDLVSTGRCALGTVLALLGVADRVHHPVALEGAVLRLRKARRSAWEPGVVCAPAEYGVFVPAVLVAIARARPGGAA